MPTVQECLLTVDKQKVVDDIMDALYQSNAPIDVSGYCTGGSCNGLYEDHRQCAACWSLAKTIAASIHQQASDLTGGMKKTRCQALVGNSKWWPSFQFARQSWADTFALLFRYSE